MTLPIALAPSTPSMLRHALSAAYPATGALVAEAIGSATAAEAMPEGVSSHLAGPDLDLGQALVRDPRIAAVGFTGSRGGGLALLPTAQSQPTRIPAYAEMSSIRPILLLPHPPRARPTALADGFAQPLTLGAQFCANPGLMIAIEGDYLNAYLARAMKLPSSAPGQTISGNDDVEVLALAPAQAGATASCAALFETSACHFICDRTLSEEMLGTASLVLRCKDDRVPRAVIAHLEGQLTVTLQLDEKDRSLAEELVPICERKAGRILCSGWATGMEACQAMVHGRPVPATSDGRSTTMGGLAIGTLHTPVCYQNFPAMLLPANLRGESGSPKFLIGYSSLGQIDGRRPIGEDIMTLRLAQGRDHVGQRRVLVAEEGTVAHVVAGARTVLDLAALAITLEAPLAEVVRRHCLGEAVDLADELEAGRLLAPIDHPDPAHLLMTGTGLTHLGSAEGRDKMHRAAAADDKPTDSMRMFLDGLQGGRPLAGEAGCQPEWFYKGDGDGLVGPGEPLCMPHFAKDGGEEPELAGIYLIGPDRRPYRLGICLANEFSDHVVERHNYLWLAHSKLRQAALGPELLVGEPPRDVRGVSRIRRGSGVLWEKPFLSGEENMSHSLANLEHHHFKYDLFRRPGDVHVHFFGTATLSFSDQVRTKVGDVFEIEAAPFQLPLRNSLERNHAAETCVAVAAL